LSAAYDPANGQVYVSLYSGSVALVDGLTITGRLKIGSYPVATLFDPDNGFVYTMNMNSANVSVINGSKVIANVNTGLEPLAAAYDPGNGYVYVADFGSSNISIINGTGIIATLPTGDAPQGIAYDALDGDMYVPASSGNLTVINGTRVVGSVPTDCFGATYDSADGFVYGFSQSGDAVLVAGLTIIDEFRDGGVLGPSSAFAAAFDNMNGNIYLPDEHGSGVAVIHGSSVLTEIPYSAGTEWGPSYTAYDDGNGYVYVVGPGAPPIYWATDAGVINATHLTRTYTVGNAPDAITYDRANGNVYILNGGSDNISVLATNSSYAVAFRESGLANETTWSVNSSTDNQLSDRPSTVFFLSNGSDTYSVGPVPGYTVSPDFGSFEVKGLGVVINLTFTRVDYEVSFLAVGLPPNTSWSIDLNGTQRFSISDVITFQEPNGSYAYSVEGSGGFGPRPPSGIATIDGQEANITIRFYVLTYFVNFTESGLPMATNWSVDLNGTRQEASSETISFEEANGSYGFDVMPLPDGYVARPASGVVAVTGEDLTLKIAFTSQVGYSWTVTFSESGLAAGSSWSVSLAGDNREAGSVSIVFSSIPNGSYMFTVGTVAGYAASPSSGTMTVAGKNATEHIMFSVVPGDGVRTGSLGLGEAWAVGVGLVIVVGAAGTIAIWLRRRRVVADREDEHSGSRSGR
jgi:YVTN family beta-propeller protein